MIHIIYLPNSVQCDEKFNKRVEFAMAEIYYYDWDVLTRSALTPEMVRKNYSVRVSITDKEKAHKFTNWLRIDEMNPTEIKEIGDVRLVIDLFTSTGELTSYFATRFDLISEDMAFKRKIDDKFREKFTFWNEGK